MANLLVVAALMAVGLVLCLDGRRLAHAVFGRRRRRLEQTPPSRQVDMQRLEEIAAVTDEEIIKAAEWWAEHPDADEPGILADLGPSAWTLTGYVPPRQVATTDPPQEPNAVLTAGVISVPPVALDYFRSELLQKINGSTAAVVIPAGMEYKPVAPIRPNPYAGCQHEDADRAEIRSLESAEPVKVIVTACPTCDRIAELKGQLAAQVERIRAMSADFAVDANADAYITKAQHVAYRKAVDEAQAIKSLIVDLEPLRVSPAAWPGRMF